jgi:hypothetical protein
VESYLVSRPNHYFSGSTTPGIADFMMFFPAWSLIEGARKGSYNVGPGLNGWWEMVMKR